MTTDAFRDEARTLDETDVLAGFRERFVIDDDSVVYLDGNSLGRPTRAGVERVQQVLTHEWGQDLIRSWERRWLTLPTRVGDLIGTTLLGASPGETVVGDTTTVALYKAISAALDARPDRTAIVIERDNFPTDRYVVESLAHRHDREIRWIDEAGPGGVTAAALDAVLDDSVAVVVLSHVDYRSAAWLDMSELTALAHRYGALTVWDLCHSVGAVPIDLPAAGADLAVGCTYKYLNGGPGSPAFSYVRADLQPVLSQPIWGWWSRVDMFDMPQGYQPQPDIRAWLTGTPGVLSLVPIEPGVALIAEAGMPRIRDKSVRLTEFLLRLYDEWLAPLGCGLASPRDPQRRGSHITVTHPDAADLTQGLIAHGVIPDFRRPDGIRLGLSPLTTTFSDVYRGLDVLRRMLT